ncbi:hypothetical protein DXZ79_10655 [Yersinia rochesterensis]|uniref:Uncharacterized protein n=1 Tax=Yersinia rochesterensis TaxID=1604335 RepID=A0A8D4SQV7_9GAMM|nr:hypothetical protein DXZ79_10655 [Yersinia rochesterensis]
MVLYLSYFKLHVRWLLSFTQIIDGRQLIGIHSLAVFLQLELFSVYINSVFTGKTSFYGTFSACAG